MTVIRDVHNGTELKVQQSELPKPAPSSNTPETACAATRVNKSTVETQQVEEAPNAGPPQDSDAVNPPAETNKGSESPHEKPNADPAETATPADPKNANATGE